MPASEKLTGPGFEMGAAVGGAIGAVAVVIIVVLLVVFLVKRSRLGISSKKSKILDACVICLECSLILHLHLINKA